MSIANNIKTALPKTDNAKEMLKFVEELSQTADKSLVGTIMSTLTTMKFDGSRSMHEHVIEMTNLSARLKSSGMEVDESFLVQFILNSLPSEYGPFQMNYNTMKDKSMYVSRFIIHFKKEKTMQNERSLQYDHLLFFGNGLVPLCGRHKQTVCERWVFLVFLQRN